jgi:hypothetical protein
MRIRNTVWGNLFKILMKGEELKVKNKKTMDSVKNIIGSSLNYALSILHYQ